MVTDLEGLLFHASRIRKEAQHAAPLLRQKLHDQFYLVLKAGAAIEAGPAPAIIKANVSGISVARSVVTAGISVRARIRVASGHTAPAVLHSAAVKITLVDRLEGLLALRGVNMDGIHQAEA